MKQFVPIEDEFPTEARRGARRLVPYQPGLACHHAWQAASAESERTVANHSLLQPWVAPRAREDHILKQQVLPKQNLSR